MCYCTRWEPVPTPAVKSWQSIFFFLESGKSPSPAYEETEWSKCAGCTQTDGCFLHGLRLAELCQLTGLVVISTVPSERRKWERWPPGPSGLEFKTETAMIVKVNLTQFLSSHRKKHFANLHSCIHTPAVQTWCLDQQSLRSTAWTTATPPTGQNTDDPICLATAKPSTYRES